MHHLQKVQQTNNIYTVQKVCTTDKKYSKLITFTLTPNMYRLQEVQQTNNIYTYTKYVPLTKSTAS